MKRPVFRFQEELLTDAPLAVLRARLETPAGLPCLRACRGLQPLEQEHEELVLRWQRARLGAVEEGTLRVAPHPTGAHLRLDGRLHGWGAFLVLAWTRWRTDRLLDRLVREL